MAAQEIYSMLHGRQDVEIQIQSMAGSAASVIAMANRSEISPVAMLMIHNVSMSGASGDYHAMQKNAEILKQMNAALASAYVAKTGKTEEEILKMMDRGNMDKRQPGTGIWFCGCNRAGQCRHGECGGRNAPDG